MKLATRILLAIGCLALFTVSWTIVLNSKSNSEKQAELITKAMEDVNNKVYVYAIPLLEEAIAYDTTRTFEAEEILKKIYLELIDQRGYSRKYTNLLEKQMRRKDATPEIYLEAANYYLEKSKLPDAFNILKEGIEKTGDKELISLYEKNRYAYRRQQHYCRKHSKRTFIRRSLRATPA